MPTREPDDGGRYVVHEHYAQNHHFDLRLERDGVLWSFAVPKGIPEELARPRLAIRVDDHSLEALHMADATPVPGVDGAVRMRIWDAGIYRTVRRSDGKWVLDLNGQRLQARYALIHTGDANWLLRLMRPR